MMSMSVNLIILNSLLAGPRFCLALYTYQSSFGVSDSHCLVMPQLMIVIGQFLNKKRGDRRKPLSGVMLQMRLNEVADLYERVQTLMHNCPEPLKLDIDSDAKSVT
jgi:hypothetical protein